MKSQWKIFSEKAISNFREKIKLPNINMDEKFSLACSGGIDSIFLLLIISSIVDKNNLLILHFNHNTRGIETDKDEEFVRSISNELSIKFFSEKRKLCKYTEESLRNDRYSFFNKIMKKVHSKYLLTAHHANDIIETIIMRLARGSSEIAAPKFFQKFNDHHYRIRPLLQVTKKEIIHFFKKNNIPWREDGSNLDQTYLRNRIRKTVKDYDQIFCDRNWENGFILSHRYLEEDSDCLDSLAKNYYTDDDVLDLNNVKYNAIISPLILAK